MLTSDEQFGDRISEDAVVITDELTRRVKRPPDWEAESCALSSLAQTMASHPERVLQETVESAMKLCRADSAGITVLEREDGLFRWHAAAGPFAVNLNGTLPRDASPCGLVISRNDMLLFAEAERRFPLLRNVQPRIYESLLAPWLVNDEPIGTLWVLQHTPEGHFDAEDARLLKNLAGFAGAAWQSVLALKAADAAQEATMAELRQSDGRARALIAHLPGAATFVVDHELRYVLAEGDALSDVGLTPADLVGRTIGEAFGPAVAEEYAPFYRQALAGETFAREHEAHGRVYLTRGGPLRDERGLVYAALAVSTDITERRRAEAALSESEQRFRLYVDNVQEYALFQTDLDGIVTSWNPGAERILGYSELEMVGQPITGLLTPEDRSASVFAQELARVLAGGHVEDARLLVRRDGTRFWARWVTEPVRDDHGRLRGVAKVLRDETERQRVDEAIRISLAEKEELLKEVHHRVKNNLQVITSLINMQASQVQDQRVLALFDETRNRVYSIAAIHELIYRSASFAEINLADYARQLVPELVRTYSVESRVQVAIEGDGATLELERAVPYGLLLNELVSNACKHAFPNGQAGHIRIIIKGADGHATLEVADNGVGVPAGFDYQRSASLGLQLVRGLARQLRATVTVQLGLGTCVKVQIPKTEEKEG